MISISIISNDPVCFFEFFFLNNEEKKEENNNERDKTKYVIQWIK